MLNVHLLSIIFLITAVGTLYLWDRILPVQTLNNPAKASNVTEHHLQSLDGLRGLLATFVFFHHSMIWYFYIQDGVWQSPPSSLFYYFGSGSVIMFFMITAFLFFSKITSNAHSKEFDWLRLYVSRFLRIAPLYLFAVFIMFWFVAYETNFTLVDDIAELQENIIHWLFFGLLSLQELNGIDAILIFAGVIWTLPYEWCFYFLLPIWGLIYQIRTPKIFYLIAILGVVLAAKNRIYLPFLLGMLSVYLYKIRWIQTFSKLPTANLMVIICCSLPILFSIDPLDWVAQFLLLVSFTLIVAGNNLFGLLSTRPLRRLGDISFSIYLLHPLVLYLTMKFIIGMDKAQKLSSTEYIGLIFILTPILITISFFTFRWIESPAIASVNFWTNRIRMFKHLISQRR
jgi:peptidoglycan/LPS O-acetylase OafA/YrhL